MSTPERVTQLVARSGSPETAFAIGFLCLMMALAAGVFALAR